MDSTSITIKYFILPSIILNLLIMSIVPTYRTAGAIYFFLLTFAWLVYATKPANSYVIGISSLKKGLVEGILFGIGFIIMNRIGPSFSIGVPTLPYSLSAQVRGLIIIVQAPIAEEIVFRGALMGVLRDFYFKEHFWPANFTQSILFMLFHFLAYGIVLGAYDHWTQVFGAFTAISGLFIGAFTFALFSGYIADETHNLIPGMIAHSIINFVIFASLAIAIIA